MKPWSVWWGLVVSTLLALACSAPRQEASPIPASAPGGAQPAWEAEWERVLEAARKEGRVVVAGVPTEEARQAGTELFEQRYGITVQYETLGGPQYTALLERMRVERAAGQYLWDLVMVGTGVWPASFIPMGLMESIEPALILPEVKDPRSWRFGLEFTDQEKLGLVMMPHTMETLIVNTRLVPGDELRSFKDLLEPKWRGQIIIHDPRIPGSGQASTAFLFFHKDLGPDYLRALVTQDLQILRDARQELDLIGQGRRAVCIGCSMVVAAPLIEKGLPIATVPPQQLREGGYLSSASANVGLFNRAPHPNAAKVYVNWLLGREGQTALAKALGVEGYWPSYREEGLIERNTKAVPFIQELFAGR
jgi:iron(III) transport system substrate-binding protein